MPDEPTPDMVTREEMERAIARERRLRRRVQLVLALTVGMLLACGAMFAWWQHRQTAAEARLAGELAAEQRWKAEQAARDQAEKTREQRVMERLSHHLLQCSAALRNEDVQRATILLEEIEQWAADERFDEFQPVVARLRTEIDVLDYLNGIETVLWVDGGPGAASIARQSAEAFRRYGVELGKTSQEEILRKVNGSPFRDRLLTALDRWHRGTQLAEVRAILKAVDPDPYRDAIRDAIAAGDKARLKELAGRPEALEQPVGFILFLCDIDDIDSARRMELLQNLVRKNPGDFRLSMALGSLYSGTGNANVEALQWYRAAVAMRPGNPAGWVGVGIALRRHGDLDAAAAAFREAIRINPAWAQFHYELGETLVLKGDIEAARDCFQQAISFDPDHAAARLALRNLAGVAPMPREVKRP